MSTAPTVVEGPGLRLHLFLPAPALAPYITLYYRTEVTSRHLIEDGLPPEWANLRFGKGAVYEAAVGSTEFQMVPEAVVAGPTSKLTYLRIARGDFWGVGLLPLGFTQFIGLPASDFADRFHDLAEVEGLAEIKAAIASIMAAPADTAGAVGTLNDLFTRLVEPSARGSDLIVEAHEALLSEDVRSVGELQSALGLGSRTLERFCRRHFGFTPQLLLRRQRFLRSLSRFLVDPSLKWIGSLDSNYHDQAQFVRDFRAFMGMLPREYARMEHPIAMTALRARRALLGAPVQVLHRPSAPPPRRADAAKMGALAAD
ncbi:helix-turn-helix domain-containing protein [Qipengyuania sp.]|uniref:helix-turn-helix domain-containing protein n=1 Tax=Qipengyuania sp. TaxID=2004515 RepID=UPI0035C8793B